jgi:hypothetical protein
MESDMKGLSKLNIEKHIKSRSVRALWHAKWRLLAFWTCLVALALGWHELRGWQFSAVFSGTVLAGLLTADALLDGWKRSI